MRNLWRNLPYRYVFLAGLLSELGTYISEVAILMRIYEASGEKNALLGVTQGLFLLAMMLGTLLGGVWGEGKRKTPVLLACELFRIPVLLLLLTYEHSAWPLILGNASVAFFSGIFNPTRQALINEILPEESLPSANALFSSLFALLHAFGPLLGATLYGFTGNLRPILQFDLVTYFLGIFFLSLLLGELKRIPLNRPHEEHTGFWEEFQSGLALAKNFPEFGWIIIRCFTASAALGILIPLLLPLAREVLRMPSYGYGLLVGTFGFGGAIGGWLAPHLLKNLTVERQLQSYFTAECLLLLAWVHTGLPAFSLLIAFFYGASLFARIAGQLTYISLRLPKTHNARANSLVDLATVIPTLLGAGIVAALGNSISIMVLLRCTALAFLLGCGALFLVERKSLR